MPTEEMLNLGGVSLAQLITSLEDSGLSRNLVLEYAGQLLLFEAGKTKKSFQYSRDLAEVAAACAPRASASFVPPVWTDGEDVVAAEGPGGFNEVFQAIRQDLDQLRADMAQAFTCMADLRAQVSRLLGELEAEINEIHGDLHACCNEGDDDNVRPQPFPTPFPLPQPLPGGSVVNDRGPLINPEWTFLGINDVLGQPHVLYNAPGGIRALPFTTVSTPDPGKTLGAGYDVGRTSRLADALELVRTDRRFLDLYAGGDVKLSAFRDALDDAVPEDLAVLQILEGLPPDTVVSGVDSLVDVLVGFEAGVVASTPGAAASFERSTGLEGEQAVARFGRLLSVDRDTANKLAALDAVRSGDIGKMSRATAKAALQAGGVELSDRKVAKLIGVGALMAKVKRVRGVS